MWQMRDSNSLCLAGQRRRPESRGFRWPQLPLCKVFVGSDAANMLHARTAVTIQTHDVGWGARYRYSGLNGVPCCGYVWKRRCIPCADAETPIGHDCDRAISLSCNRWVSRRCALRGTQG